MIDVKLLEDERIDDINENLQEGVCDSILSKKEWCGELCSTMKNGCKHWNNACVSTIIDDGRCYYKASDVHKMIREKL